MTPKELGELGHLEEAVPTVDLDDFPPVLDDALLEPGLRKSVNHLREFANLEGGKRKTIVFDFFAKPVAIEGNGRVERLVVEKTRLDERKAAVGTGETYTIDCGLIVSCIGYKTPPVEGVPYEEDRGRFANSEGVIGGGLYCVGWARRGPTGTIGTNRPDGYEVAERDRHRPGKPWQPQRLAAGLACLLLEGAQRRHRHLPRLAADRGRRGGAGAGGVAARSSSRCGDARGARAVGASLSSVAGGDGEGPAKLVEGHFTSSSSTGRRGHEQVAASPRRGWGGAHSPPVHPHPLRGQGGNGAAHCQARRDGDSVCGLSRGFS
jgi:hypothetical protein